MSSWQWQWHRQGRHAGGAVGDIASAVLSAMTDRRLTGVTLRVDGKEPFT